MSFRRLPTTFFFVAFFVLVVLLAGCGGQPDGESQDDSSGETQNQESSGGGQTSVETKMAIGRVADAGVEGRRLVARSNTGDQGAQRMIFVVTKHARITLDGQEATLEAAQKGPQAQVKYLVKNDRNRAREVSLFGRESPSGNGGTSG